MAAFSGGGAIAAAAIPAVASLLSGKQKGTVNTVQSNDPWSGVQPYLLDAFGRGQGLLGEPAIGARSPYSTEAIAEQARLARAGQPLVTQAQGELGRVLGGEYLDVDKNPYVQRAAQRGIDQSLIGVNSRFGPEGFGGSANREWATRIASEAAIPFYANEYGRERGNMMNAMQMAPGLSMASYLPSQQLAAAGGAEEARTQAELDAPWAQLSRYRGLLTGTPGGTTTTQQPYFTNPAASVLGGGLAGLQLYNQWPGSSAQQPGMAGPAPGYNDFVGNAWDSGFGSAFTQQGIYG